MEDVDDLRLPWSLSCFDLEHDYSAGLCASMEFVKVTAITDHAKTSCKDGERSAERLLSILFVSSWFGIRFINIDRDVLRSTVLGIVVPLRGAVFLSRHGVWCKKAKLETLTKQRVQSKHQREYYGVILY